MYIRHGGNVIINTLTIWYPQGKWFSPLTNINDFASNKNVEIQGFGGF